MMELEVKKKYECRRKSNGEIVCTIGIMNLVWIDTKSDRTKYDYDRDLREIGKFVFKDIKNRTDIFEIMFSPNPIFSTNIYIKWLCKDFEINYIGDIN